MSEKQLIYSLVLVIGSALNTCGQNYYDLILGPNMLSNIYERNDSQTQVRMTCCLNDTLYDWQKKITYDDNRNVSELTIRPLSDGEFRLIYDSLQRLKVCRYDFVLTDNNSWTEYLYNYIDNNTIEVVLTFDGTRKESISHLVYNKKNRLTQFSQIRFYGDSIERIEFKVEHLKDKLIIERFEHRETYIFNKNNQVIEMYLNERPLRKLNYHPNGKLREEMRYFNGKSSYVSSVDRYSYDDRFNLQEVEHSKLNMPGELQSNLRCTYYQE